MTDFEQIKPSQSQWLVVAVAVALALAALISLRLLNFSYSIVNL